MGDAWCTIAAAMPLTPGARLGQYVIRSLLGSGGMGEVYLAHDTRLDRDVALKLLPAELANDSERLRRFELEARSASALNHPAIVAIYDLGQAESQPYISMELVEGQTLRQILQAGPMPLAARLAGCRPDRRRAREGPRGGDRAPGPQAGKPHGLARRVCQDSRLRPGEARRRCRCARGAADHDRAGHPAWHRHGDGRLHVSRAGERRHGGHRSDQFSFGLVLYEMLTGRRAFNRPTAVETLSAIIRDDPPPVGQLNPSVPAPVRWIVDRCLAKTPADRYGSTRDLARDLASARDHFSELTSSGATAVSARAAARGQRRELVAWLLVATLGVAARPDGPPAQAARGAGPDRALHDRAAGERQLRCRHWNVAIRRFARRAPTGVCRLGADKRRRLWLHSFDSLVARPLPGTEGAIGPFWSPDGLAVGFFRRTG